MGVYGTTPIPKQTDVPVLADGGCRSRDLSNLDRIFPPPVTSQLEFVGLRCHSDRGSLFTAVWKSSQRPGFSPCLIGGPADGHRRWGWIIFAVEFHDRNIDPFGCFSPYFFCGSQRLRSTFIRGRLERLQRRQPLVLG